MSKRVLSIGIVTGPLPSEQIVPLSNIVDILSFVSYSLYIITGNAGRFLRSSNYGKLNVYLVNHKPWGNIFARVVKFIYMQFKLSYRLIKISRNVDLWFLFHGEKLLLPMLTAKLLRQKVVFALTGSATKMEIFSNGIFIKPITILQKANVILSNRIILYSPGLIKEWGLEKYSRKISIAHTHFLDFSKFKVEKPLNGRDNLIGYIGRLSQEKGILNFMEAIPKVLERDDHIQILIGGDGQLHTKVEQYVDEQNLNSKVKILGWIPHNELPKYLNNLKLLVLPSYTEGLPNIMLEAMACGTPVLATAVGAMPDVIKDSETGFIMEDNSPECIAQNIIRALSHPNLEEITRNARVLVEEEFTYEVAVQRYRSILTNLIQGQGTKCI